MVAHARSDVATSNCVAWGTKAIDLVAEDVVEIVGRFAAEALTLEGASAELPPNTQWFRVCEPALLSDASSRDRRVYCFARLDVRK